MILYEGRRPTEGNVVFKQKKHKKDEEEDIDNDVRYLGAHPFYGALSRSELIPIKPAYTIAVGRMVGYVNSRRL